jgi:hypothetical protein
MSVRHWAIGVLFAVAACGDDGGQEPIERDAAIDPVTQEQDASIRADARVDAQVIRDAAVATDAGSAALDARAPDASARDAGTAKASWLIAPGDKVFFVGNSFFDTGDRKLSQWVEAIGQSVTPTFAIETGDHNVPGVQPLTWFFEQDESQAAIDSGDWDVFILQGADEEPVNDKAGFFEGVRAYHDAITVKGGKVMLFMTWDWKWNGGPDSDFLQKLAAAYDEIGAELNIPVIPVGEIYNDTEKDPFPGEDPWFLTDGDLHQNAAGSAVNAYATFSMLTGIDAMGVDFDAQNNDNSPEMLRYCSDKSWARVMERLQD